MEYLNEYYNVEKKMVICGSGVSYVEFMNRLNKYLLCKYGSFYEGLQLYEDNDDCKTFTLIAKYKYVPDICEKMECISKDIDEKYKTEFCGTVEDISIVDFLKNKRVVPYLDCDCGHR